MIVLHPEVKLEIKPSHTKGHEWHTFRLGTLIGTGWAAGGVSDALEDALDDLRMLGLVETREPSNG